MSKAAKGLERAPVAPFGQLPVEGATSPEARSSLAIGTSLLNYKAAASKRLGLHSENPFIFDDYAEAWYELRLYYAQRESHFRRRTVSDVAQDYLNTSTNRFINEFRHQTVIDEGCGEGLVGRELARKAKAKVTFLDRDPDVLELISDTFGTKVLADAEDLEFENESFNKSLSIFSAIFWAESPLAAVRSINEQLRVTAVGGSALIIPLFQDLRMRAWNFDVLMSRHQNGIDVSNRLAVLRTFELKDVMLISTLERLALSGTVGITWISDKKPNSITDVVNISAIVDKYEPIPPEVFAENVAQTAAYCSVS